MKKIQRERIELDESFEDQTSEGPWNYKGEDYNYVTEIKEFGDGEEHNVIVKRKSDGKFFKFCWVYYHRNGDYQFDNEMIEVFEELTITYK